MTYIHIRTILLYLYALGNYALIYLYIILYRYVLCTDDYIVIIFYYVYTYLLRVIIKQDYLNYYFIELTSIKIDNENSSALDMSCIFNDFFLLKFQYFLVDYTLKIGLDRNYLEIPSAIIHKKLVLFLLRPTLPLINMQVI